MALAVEGPVAIRAGAGTGKTRAITHRIAYACASGAHDPRRSLALTFTNRAAGEMRARLGSLGVEGVQVRTFHAAALRQLRYFWPRVVQGSLPRIAPRSEGLFEQAAAATSLSFDRHALRSTREAIDALRLQRNGVDDVAPEDFDAFDVDPQAGIALWRAYDQVKTDTGVIDFTDVLEVTSGMFGEHPELLREVHRTYQWFTVDEYQDVSPLQWDLLRAWRGTHDDVCVVGDANQTIYGFAGATPSYLLDFAQEFPRAQQYALTACYRCTPQIVGIANTLMASAPTFIELRSQRASGVEPEITEYGDDHAEARAVAQHIDALITSGIDPRSIAVLFRTNAQSAPFEVAFADQGIATVLRGGDRFFDRPEVKEAMLRLRMAPPEHVAVATRVRRILGEMGWQAALPAGRARASWESLSTIVALAEDQPWESLTDFVVHLQERARVEHLPTPFGVTLSTLHASKGLEWSHVFLVGCSEGLVPLESGEIDEERRLVYVGITRAKDALHVSWSRHRREGDRERTCSRFFAGTDVWQVQPTPSAMIASATPRGQRGPATCRMCGRALSTAKERTLTRCEACPGELDVGIVTSLIDWRASIAERRGVPPFQVLTDIAVTAIAELRPGSLVELAAIPGTRWLGEDASDVLVIVTEPGHPLVEH